jgi:hypothetical protein
VEDYISLLSEANALRKKWVTFLKSTIKQDKWQGFGLAKCIKSDKWLPISINTFLSLVWLIRLTFLEEWQCIRLSKTTHHPTPYSKDMRRSGT